MNVEVKHKKQNATEDANTDDLTRPVGRRRAYRKYHARCVKACWRCQMHGVASDEKNGKPIHIHSGGSFLCEARLSDWNGMEAALDAGPLNDHPKIKKLSH